MNPDAPWTARVLRSWSADAWLILWGVALSVLGRGAMILALRDQFTAVPTIDDLVQAFSFGLRFDVRQAVMIALPTLVAGLIWPGHRILDRLRVILGAALAVVVLVATVCSVYYFREYRDQFNHFVFLGLNEDQQALLGTIWKAYPVGWLLTACVATGVLAPLLLRWAFPRLPRWDATRWPVALHIVALVVALGLVVVGARGSAGRLVVSIKSAGVTGNDTLNKLIPPPLDCLRYAWSLWRKSSAEGDVTRWLPDGDLKAAVTRLGGNAQASDLDQAFLRTAAGATAPPKQVVVVVMESYSSWPLWTPYDQLGLAETGRRLSQEGQRLDRFLSTGPGTLYSLVGLLMGLPDTGLMASYQPQAVRPMPTSLGVTFQRLGYRTRFVYSGFLTWLRIGDWARAQGFDEVLGAGDLARGLGGQEWGIADEELFAASQRLLDGDDRPTLTVILTTSNHPPYSVDVAAKGYVPRPAPPGITVQDDDPRILGHFWYSDRALGRFTDRLRDRPGVLLAMTGDHYGRRFINGHPTPAERTAVPLILWGSGLDPALRFAPDTAGSHLDLTPTLVERCAPAGFTYASLGRDLLAPGADLGLGRDAAVSAKGFLDFAAPGESPAYSAEEIARLRRRYDDLLGVGFWRLTRGPGWR
jgi:phosphoglycerol transferase MdoB-like AlkP superfamily enzyme